MPATESTWRNQVLLHRIFAVSGIILTLSTVWMFYKDHARPWKSIQPKAVEIEQVSNVWRQEQVQATDAYLAHDQFEKEWRVASTAGINEAVIAEFVAAMEEDAKVRGTSASTQRIVKDNQALNTLASEAETVRQTVVAAAKKLEKAPTDTTLQGELARLEKESQSKDNKVRAARQKLIDELRYQAIAAKNLEDKALNSRKVQNGKIDAAKANLDIAIRDGLPTEPRQKIIDELINNKDSGYAVLNLEYQRLSAHRKLLEKLIKQITADEIAAKKAADDAKSALVRLQTAYVEKRETYFTDSFPFLGKKILTFPIIDAFGTPRKVDNLWSKDLEQDYVFSKVRRFDRCTTCHQAMQKSMPGEATSPAYVGEHRFDLRIVPPSAEELPKAAKAEDGSTIPPSLEVVLGIRLAERGLVNDDDVTVRFVRPRSAAAKAEVIPGGSAIHEVPGEKIRQEDAQFVTEADPKESLYPTRPGLMVGDVIEGIDGEDLFGATQDPVRAAALLVDKAALGKPLLVTVRRGLPHPFTSHPRLDLYVSDSSPHKMSTFACTVCHDGQGSATEFKWASHTPNTVEEADRWASEYGWFDNHHWIYPQYPKRFAESACLKCHHEVVDLEASEKFPEAPAPKVTHGYQLIRKFGCFGCHEVNGFDGPSKRVGPDLRLEPNYFAVAQELRRGLPLLERSLAEKRDQQLAAKVDDKTVAEWEALRQKALLAQITAEKGKADLAASSDPDKDTKLAQLDTELNKSKDEAEVLATKLAPAKKELSVVEGGLAKIGDIYRLTSQLTAHPEDDAARGELKSILDEDASLNKAATLTPAEHRLASMLKDVEVAGALRKAGPSLRYVGQKLDNAFLFDWLKDPRSFRPSTRMPQFFGLWKHFEGQKDQMAHDLEPIEIRGIMAYLASYQQEFEPVKPPEGVSDWTEEEKAARGKTQFQLRGCLACHTHGDFPDVAKYRKPGEIVQGPDLTGIGSKFDPARNPQGPTWLYSWIKEPTRYHARTVMPNLFLDKEALPKKDPMDEAEAVLYVDHAADIAAYLLASKSAWKPAPEAAQSIKNDNAALSHLDLLTMEHLKGAFFEELATEYLDKGIPAAIEADLKGAEKELVAKEGVDRTDQKLRYIGRKTISKYGCFGCHDIPGFEDAKPIGTGLADWGRKDPSKLAFEHITHYLEHHGSADHAEHKPDHDAPEAAHTEESHSAANSSAEEAESEEYFHHQIEAGSRIGFIYQKLREPRSYDFEKTHNKGYNDRLRMPQFPFNLEEREALITFVLGLVADPPREKYLYKPSQRDAALITGKQVLEKYNCAGCHILEGETWKTSYAPGAFGPQMAKDPRDTIFPYLIPHVTAADLEKQAQPDGRNELHSVLRGLPRLAAEDGLPVLMDEEGGGLTPEDPFDPTTISHKLDLYQSVIIDGHSYRADGDSPVNIAASMIDTRYPANGGVLTRYLLPYVTEAEKQSYSTNYGSRVLSGKALGDQAWGWLPPPLMGEGSKVQAEWLHSFLLEPYPIRPAVFLRMPKFNMSSKEATALVNYFSAKDNANYPYEANSARDESRLAHSERSYREKLGALMETAAERSARFDDAMKIVVNKNYCTQCHKVGDYLPTGASSSSGPNLADVYRRLRPNYVRDWIAKPKTILPYTPMPVNIPYFAGVPFSGGVSQDLYHGTSEEQVEALVDLLMNYDQFAKTNTIVKSMVPATPPAAAPKPTEPAESTAETGEKNDEK